MLPVQLAPHAKSSQYRHPHARAKFFDFRVWNVVCGIGYFSKSAEAKSLGRLDGYGHLRPGPRLQGQCA